MLFIPHVLLLALPFAALLTMTKAKELQEDAAHEASAVLVSKSSQGTGLRTLRDTGVPQAQQPFKILITDTCVQKDTQGDAGTLAYDQGKELDLEPGKPLVLTHRISLVPTSCTGGCESEFAALRQRMEKLEREVTTLKEKCKGAEGGCCNQQGAGAGCSKCPNDCSDQGRCVDGKCVCFPGFTGPDCSSPTCPSNCSNKGKCVNGKCVCHSGFSGTDCSEKACPGNCRNRGQCVNGKCVCDSGYTGLDCSEKACPNNCRIRGQCVNGKCVCDSGYTGLDCSEKACPNNCSNKGRCLNGKCVCSSGFTGPNCSEKACPHSCRNRGQCVSGKCVCVFGFTGSDCSEKACPSNCSNRGRCVNGKCVCDSGFAGPDCFEKACFSNCNDKGQCVNGKCVCDSGFAGLDCSEKTCPRNCNDRGRCVNGKCECDAGFTGSDCSTKSCPDNCSDRGRCVNGKCVCDVGFAGLDCSLKSCPANCNNRGSCVNGKCVCRDGFAGSDCSQCQAGFTGPHCSTVLSAVTQLRSRDITDSSVTILWTQPSVQYDIYHISFTSKKEGDQAVTSTVEGSLSTYIQTGLAPGQEYTVTIRGEKDGVMGPEARIVFTTLISGPKDLRVVKTTTTTAVVRWQPPQGDIDRYRLFVSPSQTEGTMTGKGIMVLPPAKESAHIQGLEAGHLYNITLVAQKGRSLSQPITVHVMPGNMTMAKGIVSTKKPPKMDITAGKKNPDRTIFYKVEDGKREIVGSAKEGYVKETETGSSVTRGLKRPEAKDRKIVSKPGGKLKKSEITRLRWYNGTRTGAGVVKKEGKTLPKQPWIKKPTERKTLMSESKLPAVKKGGLECGKKEPETLTYRANRTHNYSSWKHESENLNNLTKSLNVWENRTDTDLEFVRQHTMDGKNDSETQGKKCNKKASGNETMVDTVLGSSNSSITDGIAVQVVNIAERTDTTRRRPFKTNGTLIPSKRPVANLDTSPTKVATANQVSPTARSAETQTPTDQSKAYLSHSPTYSPNSFPQPPSPPPSASSFLGPIMADNEKLRGSKSRVIQNSGSVTSSIYAAFPSVQLSRAAPTLHPNSGNFNTEHKAGHSEPLSSITELDRGVLSQNGDVKNEKREEETLKADKVEMRKNEGKTPTSHYPHPRNTSLHRIPIRRFHNRTRAILTPPYRLSSGILLRPMGTKTKIKNLVKGSNITERKIASGYMKTDLIGNLRGTGLTPKTLPSDLEDSSQDVTTTGTQASTVNIYSKVSTDGQSNPSTSATEKPGPGISSVGVQNITSRGFVLTWEAPEGMFKNFIVSRLELVTKNRNGTHEESEEESGDNESSKQEETVKGDGDKEMAKAGLGEALNKEAGDPGIASRSKSKADSYRKGPQESGSRTSETTSTSKPYHGPRARVQSPRKFLQVPGTARSLQIQNLHPQTRYSVLLYGRGLGIRSKIQQLEIVTGPEPPSDLRFSNVTDSSLSVSWIKPKTAVTGYKVTFAPMKDGEPVSLSLNPQQSSVPLSALSPGSSYEVSVTSTQGADESDPLKGVVVTAPDPPTDLRVINITDTNALLVWRPALAAVDQYIIAYGSDKGSHTTMSVSGNAAEQQLKGLRGSSHYTVTVTSQLGNQQSRETTTQFTTTSGSSERLQGPRDLTASHVSPQSAILTWKPPTSKLRSYKLTYQTAGQEIVEVTLDGSTTQHKLKRLKPKSKYTVMLQGEQNGQYSVAVSTGFTTGTLRFPHPTDCSQELMNEIQSSGETEIFPNGPQGQSALVFCDMETDGGGWTVIQRRMDGKTNFFRSWREYSAGFGNISGEFWIGNELLHNLTRVTPMALRIDLRSGSESVFAHYSSFSVDAQKKHYSISVSGYSGTAGDSMKYHNGRPFSTKDRDPNPFVTRCAMSYRGGWWYKNCHEANLNGLYNTHTNHQGVIWTEWKGKDFSIPFTEMKIRPSSFNPWTRG